MAILLALASCTNQEQAAGPQYEIVMNMYHTMELIIDPAADIIWSSAGSITTEAGEEDLAPTTPEGWTEVEAAAAVLAESGNLLMLPGRSAGPDWDKFSRELTRTSKLAIAAAQQQDANALFDAGGHIYQACLGCHNQYLINSGAN